MPPPGRTSIRHERRGQPETAYLEFGKAVALAPGRVEYRFELATALQQLNKYPQALAQYDTMIQLAPDNPVVRYNYAVCLYAIGRLADARVQLEAARRLKVGQATLYRKIRKFGIDREEQ